MPSNTSPNDLPRGVLETSRQRAHHKIVRPSRRRTRPWLIALIVLVGLLVGLQLIVSPVVRHVVNKKLAGAPGFSGHTDSVNVALWRGAVELKDLEIATRGQDQEPPILRIKNASVKFAPGQLFRGKLGGTAVVDGAELNIVKREQVNATDAAKKTKNEIKEKKEDIQHWQDVLRNAFPVTLARLELKNLRVHFIDRSHQPNVDLGIEDVHVIARDLQNRPKANGDPFPAKADITGLVAGTGQLKITLQLDPIAHQPRFSVKFELRELQLPPLNNFLQAYADADVSRGTFELFSEINAENGAYDGYVKPLFHDLDFRNASDKDKSPAKLLKEKVVSAVASVLKNDENKQVATKAPFAGNFTDNEVDIWTTIVNLLRNAFVQAIRGGLEGQTPRR